MGKLVIDGNKVYTVDEDCMKKKNLTLTQIRQKETGENAVPMRNPPGRARRSNDAPSGLFSEQRRPDVSSSGRRFAISGIVVIL